MHEKHDIIIKKDRIISRLLCSIINLSEPFSILFLYIAILMSEDGPLERDRTLCQVPLTLLIANYNSEAILIMCV